MNMQMTEADWLACEDARALWWYPEGRIGDRQARPFDAACLGWQGGAVARLAQANSEERALERLPGLADAVEEGGCVDENVVGHCRQDGEHAPGCWVVDMLLAKEGDAPTRNDR